MEDNITEKQRQTMNFKVHSCQKIITFLLLLFFITRMMDMPILSAGQGYQNVTLGSSLEPIGTSTSWVSPSGDFAFGFLPFAGNFLLAIWFDKIPNRTVVWSAPADVPLKGDSRLDLTQTGRLVLTNSSNMEVWIANGEGSSVSHAAMLDTGNFVLVNGGKMGGYKWQSFEHPTDTLLPTQVIPLGSNIMSHLTYTDYSTGRFVFDIQLDGDLVLQLINPQTRDRYRPYWKAGTTGNGSQLVFDASGNVYMALVSGGFFNVTSDSVPRKDFYQRATLDPDGVFRQYRYPKYSNITQEGSWTKGWSLADQVPLDICTALMTLVGGGACGFNAYCQTVNRRTICQCPEGYSFLDQEREYLGCQPNFPLQTCKDNGSSTSYEIIQIQNTDWPISDYEYYTGLTQDACGEECLKDCLCAVAIYGGRSECWKKKLPLSNGRMDTTSDRTALLKISRVAVPSTTNAQPYLIISQKKAQTPSVLTWSLILASSVFIILALVATSIFLFCSRRKETVQYNMRSFTYKELEIATRGFKEELGKGGFGTVYKGFFLGEPSIPIAVKRLDKLDIEAENQFTTEVTAIGRSHHKNLVQLLGFCSEGLHRLLVYEFMSHGSLADFLFGGSPPDWITRIKIAHGISRGIRYLHEECNTQIIHCDIKPHNILLDESFNPKISDFGIAKLLKEDQTRTMTRIKGTIGYLAPDWFQLTPISAKVDVYSFGVVLLEIICCRKNIDDDAEPDKIILTNWVTECYKNGNIQLLAEVAFTDELERLVTLALWCIQADSSLRPSMKKVAQTLEDVVEQPIPPPFSSSSPFSF